MTVEKKKKKNARKINLHVPENDWTRCQSPEGIRADPVTGMQISTDQAYQY